jgi:equilibrative nucleoside transporter 1/2/3
MSQNDQSHMGVSVPSAAAAPEGQPLLIDHHSDPDKVEPIMEGLTAACVCYTLVGIGYLFPFSALTLPVDYWAYLFPSYNIDFEITSLFIYSNLLMLAILVSPFSNRTSSYSEVIGEERKSSFWRHPAHGLSKKTRIFANRVIFGLVGQFLTLVFVPTSYFFKFSEHSNEVAILTATAISAVATAFLDSSMIALVSQYPIRVAESFQLGVGLSSFIGAIYRDFTKLVMPASEVVASSLIYFYVGAATILLCAVAFWYVLALPISQYHLSAERTSMHESVSEHHIQPAPEVVDDLRMSPGRPYSRIWGKKNNSRHAQGSPQLVSSPSSLKRSAILKKVIFNGVTVSFVFCVTLCLYPPLVTEIPVHQYAAYFPKETNWWPLLLLTLFSVLDIVGRICVRFRGPFTKSNIWIAALLRSILVPLTVFCVQSRLGFTNDWWSLVLVSILGFTNGYIGTLAIVFVTEGLDPAEQATAGMFTSFFLNLGLVLGASVGLLFGKFIAGQSL